MKDKFPLHLGVEHCVTAVATKDHPNNCEGALQEVLNRWLEGARSTGGEARTWCSVLKALENSRKGELAKQLRVLQTVARSTM